MSGGPCRNCGATLVGRWCHACGQDALDPFGAARLLLAEWADAVWGWDSRLTRTLRLLLTEPGALIAEQVAGRRARFVGPLRLYLVVSAAFFASYALTPDPVLALIGGLGDLELGWARIATIAHWLPALMIVLIPSCALALAAAFRRPPRPFLQHLGFTLHFGTASFFTLVLAQLGGVATRAVGAEGTDVALLFSAHAFNASWLYLGARRFYGLPPGATTARLALGVAMMVLVMSGLAGGAARLLGG